MSGSALPGNVVLEIIKSNRLIDSFLGPAAQPQSVEVEEVCLPQAFQPLMGDPVLSVVFTSNQLEAFTQSLELLNLTQVDEVMVAAGESYAPLMNAINRVSYDFGITNVAGALSKMAEIVTNHCNQLQAKK